MRFLVLAWIWLHLNSISMIYPTSAPNLFLFLIPNIWGVPTSEIHLLLGIKNTNLDLVWIKTLPSGIAVYQSVFKDIWGSDLIFAGPHKTFTNGNKTSNVNHVIFGIHSVISEPEDEHDIWTDEDEYAIISNTELSLTVNSVPLNLEDLLDVDGEICILQIATTKILGLMGENML